MSPKAVLLFCLPLASVAAGVAVLAELNHQSGQPVPVSDLLWVMITRFAEVLLFAIFGLLAARGSGLRGSVIMTADDGKAAFQSIVNFGVLPGFVLGITNYLFFFYNRYSPFVDERIREMDTIYDVLIMSLDAGLFEEVIYRLFIMSSLLFLFAHLYQTLRQVRPTLVSVLPRTMALVISSLLFAIAHNVTGFTAAFVGGVMLGFLFMRSGVESAIGAHFAANVLFFSASYLS